MYGLVASGQNIKLCSAILTPPLNVNLSLSSYAHFYLPTDRKANDKTGLSV